MATKAPHTLIRDHKQLYNRTPGTIIGLHCPDCHNRRIAQLVYIMRNTVDLVWTEEDRRDHSNNALDPKEAIRRAQLDHDAADTIVIEPTNHQSTGLDQISEPAGEPAAPAPFQDVLPWETLAEHATHHYIAKLIPELEQAFAGLTGQDKDLAMILTLSSISSRTSTLTDNKARQMLRFGVRQTDIASALGVSKQAVHKRLRSTLN